MIGTVEEGSGGVWIREHTRFVHGVLHDLRSFGMG
jgi:hypothetical protein